jgi:hypothetical protein
MKSEFLGRGKLVATVFALIFSTAVQAQDRLEPTWVKDGVNWEQYNKFLVKPLNVDDVKVLRPPWAEDDPEDWTLQIEDLQGMQAMFRDIMKDVLTADDGYPVVYLDGEDVLEVEVEILNIMPWLRPGSDGSDDDGHTVKTLGSGELKARVELRDSQTRELLLLIEGVGAVGEKYKTFNAKNNIANVQGMFNSFANRLRNSMDRVHDK